MVPLRFIGRLVRCSRPRRRPLVVLCTADDTAAIEFRIKRPLRPDVSRVGGWTSWRCCCCCAVDVVSLGNGFPKISHLSCVHVVAAERSLPSFRSGSLIRLVVVAVDMPEPPCHRQEVGIGSALGSDGISCCLHGLGFSSPSRSKDRPSLRPRILATLHRPLVFRAQSAPACWPPRQPTPLVPHGSIFVPTNLQRSKDADPRPTSFRPSSPRMQSASSVPNPEAPPPSFQIVVAVKGQPNAQQQEQQSARRLDRLPCPPCALVGVRRVLASLNCLLRGPPRSVTKACRSWYRLRGEERARKGRSRFPLELSIFYMSASVLCRSYY